MRGGIAYGVVMIGALIGASVVARNGRVESVATPAGGEAFQPRAAGSFTNWESPHVHPMDTTPDGRRLLVVNTPAATLDVFWITSGTPTFAYSVPVGLDPVTVRARGNGEAWVVNHISDSVSVVDLASRTVVRTLPTADEPCDVVFARPQGGNPTRAFVSCAQPSLVQVFDLANPGAAPTSVPIFAEDPRSLAVSPDGSRVYAAVFKSGNNTTILGGGALNTGAGMRLAYPPNVVSNPAGPYAGVNPPPNSGNAFVPALGPGIGPGLPVGLIVRKNASGQWLDDNARDWTAFVSGANASASGRLPGWTLADNDLASINASTLSVSYANTLMNLCMSVGVNPVTGQIAVVGTEATNQLRFEPNVNGKFVRVEMASVDPLNFANRLIADLNPHLTYATSQVAQSERNKSLGDPRAVEWNAAGTKAYVAGMGSNNVVVVNARGLRVGLTDTIEVGEGPTGIALKESAGLMYVLNRFAGTISVVSLATETQVGVVPLFDPTPAAIKIGRKHLYDTHKNSGLGQAACASCHVDARMDRLAWDLGDPSGTIDPLGANNLGFGLPGLSGPSNQVPFQPFHPMKGPMTTQTLQDIIGQEPHHWRGDRAGIEAFAPAFQGLQGDDATLTPAEMQEFEDYLATIHFPPNPFRNFDNTLPTSLPLPGHFTTGRFAPAGSPLPNGNAVNGLAIYRSGSRRLDANTFACVTCHTLPTGAGPDVTLVGLQYQPIAPGPKGERHRALVSVDGSTNISMKVPQTRNVADKTGFNTTQLVNTAGFGFLHDGSVDSIERFISEPVFNVASDQEVADLTALMLAFSGSDLPNGSSTTPLEPPGGASKDTHAAVGQQTTLRSALAPDPGQNALIASMIAQANTNKVGLIVKGNVNGVPRGYSYAGANTFQSDKAGQTIAASALQALASEGNELTYTVVVKGAETRLGIDADLDGTLNGDEPPACPADLDDGSATGTKDGGVGIEDLLYYLTLFQAGVIQADLDDGLGLGEPDGGVGIEDLLYYLSRFAVGC